jgi:hypothetical protein
MNVLMMMSGITASLIEEPRWKLLLYSVGCILHILILVMSWLHFREGIRRFRASGIEIGDLVANRLCFAAVCHGTLRFACLCPRVGPAFEI